MLRIYKNIVIYIYSYRLSEFEFSYPVESVVAMHVNTRITIHTIKESFVVALSIRDFSINKRQQVNVTNFDTLKYHTFLVSRGIYDFRTHSYSFSCLLSCHFIRRNTMNLM